MWFTDIFHVILLFTAIKFNIPSNPIWQHFLKWAFLWRSLQCFIFVDIDKPTHEMIMGVPLQCLFNLKVNLVCSNPSHHIDFSRHPMQWDKRNKLVAIALIKEYLVHEIIFLQGYPTRRTLCKIHYCTIPSLVIWTNCSTCHYWYIVQGGQKFWSSVSIAQVHVAHNLWIRIHSSIFCRW